LEFTDHATGDAQGFDPGANQVIGKIEGIGSRSLRVSKYFFELLESQGIPTHYVHADNSTNTMEVKKAVLIPLEWVGRFQTAGSACKTYGVKQGLHLEPMAMETMLKSDSLEDPRINRSMSVGLGFISDTVYGECLEWTHKIGLSLRSSLQLFGLELIDYKIEFGYDEQGHVMLIDEISAAVWRVAYHGQLISSDESMRIVLNGLAC
jgi:phosphoribosylaminoimidazole-succinocarboxamide synthase